MYFEVWLDPVKKHDTLQKLQEVCEEVHEVFYDYDCIVRVDKEEKLKVEGVVKYRKHYDC